MLGTTCAPALTCILRRLPRGGHVEAGRNAESVGNVEKLGTTSAPVHYSFPKRRRSGSQVVADDASVADAGKLDTTLAPVPRSIRTESRLGAADEASESAVTAIKQGTIVALVQNYTLTEQ